MTTPKKPSAFSATVTTSPELQKVVGAEPITRAELTKRLWEYIKSKGLQNPAKKSEIRPDAVLAAVFGSEDIVGMMQLPGLVNKHVIKTPVAA